MKRTEFSAMEFFVLATISRGGLTSLYELQRGVGLQPGGIHPVLKRLETDGFLDRSEQRQRRRRTMTLTSEGERLLEEQWRSCLRSYPDVESILRVATLACLMHHQETAHSYLRSVADHYERDLPKTPDDPHKGNLAPVAWYAFMRRLWEVKRRESAAEVFRAVASELEGARRS